jgi:excisionase family DNA binding protein
MSENRLYTTKEAAPLVGVSRRKLQSMCAARQIDHIEVPGETNRRVVYKLTEAQIRAWRNTHTVKAVQA